MQPHAGYLSADCACGCLVKPLLGLERELRCTQVAFMLPTAYPITFATFNYAPVSVAVAIIIICLAWCLPRYGARRAFLEGTRSLKSNPSAKVRHSQLFTHL